MSVRDRHRVPLIPSELRLTTLDIALLLLLLMAIASPFWFPPMKVMVSSSFLPSLPPRIAPLLRQAASPEVRSCVSPSFCNVALDTGRSRLFQTIGHDTELSLPVTSPHRSEAIDRNLVVQSRGKCIDGLIMTRMRRGSDFSMKSRRYTSINSLRCPVPQYVT